MSGAGSIEAAARRRFQARALAAMFGAGAVLGLVSAVLPHGEGVNEWAWAINASLGFPTAALLVIFAGRTPEWVLHALLVVGAGMVSLGVIFGAGGPASVATSFFYVWVALYVFWFFSLRVAIAHLVLDSLLFAGVLRIEGAPAGPAVWLLVTGTATVVGVVVALMNRELVRAANIDALTGLPTRVMFDDAVAREIARAERNRTALCLAIVDVDGLKAVNDQHGHQAGDRVLTEAAQAWRGGVRATATCSCASGVTSSSPCFRGVRRRSPTGWSNGCAARRRSRVRSGLRGGAAATTPSTSWAGPTPSCTRRSASAGSRARNRRQRTTQTLAS